MARPLKNPFLAFAFPFSRSAIADFSLRGIVTSGTPPTYPTSRDAAVVLTLLGQISSRRIDLAAPLHTLSPEAKAFRLGVAKIVEKGSAWNGRHPCYDLYHPVGYDRRDDFVRALGRLSECSVNGVRLFSGLFEISESATYVRTYVPGSIVKKFHPDLQSPELVVDVRKVGVLRCRHSAPIYLRALAWLDGHVTAGLEIGLDDAGVVSALVPAKDVPERLGLDLDRWKPAEFGRTSRAVVADLGGIGVGAEFSWQGFGRNPHLRLLLRFKFLESIPTTGPAARGSYKVVDDPKPEGSVRNSVDLDAPTPPEATDDPPVVRTTPDVDDYSRDLVRRAIEEPEEEEADEW